MKNLSIINNNTLSIMVKPSISNSYSQSLYFSYQAISLSGYELKLQLNFDNPLYVTSGLVSFPI